MISENLLLLHILGEVGEVHIALAGQRVVHSESSQQVEVGNFDKKNIFLP